MRTIGSKVSSSDLANILDDNSTPAGPTENLSLWNTFGQLFKDSLPGRTTTSGPTSSVKLLLVAVFVGLHVLNLITPLSSHFKIHAPLSSSNGAQAMSPALTTMLQELSSMFPKDVSLVAHLHTAQAVQAAPVGIPTEGMDFASDYFTSSPLGLLDWVFTAWGHLTGDPVMSKWISLALGISVFLNGYLLKGIALGSSRVEAAEAAARILLTATGQLTADDTKPGKILRRHSLGAESMPVIRPKYSRQFQENTSIPEEPRSRTSSQSSASGKPELASMSPIEPLSAQRTTLSSDNNTVIDGSSSATTLKPTIALSSASSTTASTNFSDNGASTPATTAIDSEDGVILPSKPRPFDECANLFDAGQALLLSDEEIIMLVQKGKVAAYSLEKLLKDHQRAVRIRRALICKYIPTLP